MRAEDWRDVGRATYEADVARRPTYPDGKPRKTWEQLADWAKQQWAFKAEAA